MMRTSYRRVIYVIIILIGAAWILSIVVRSLDSNSTSTAAPQQGFPAPDFELATTTGEVIRLSDFRGQAVLLNLWATWCPPCREEMPAINQVYNEFKNQGLVVLAMNMTYQDDVSAVAPFIERYELTFPILLDETGDIARDYQMRSLPTSFFIDRNGIINEVVIGGPMAESLLRERVEKIIE